MAQKRVKMLDQMKVINRSMPISAVHEENGSEGEIF